MVGTLSLCPPSTTPRHDAAHANSRTNGLDIVAVGIDQERGEIGRAVIGPRAGPAIVAAAGLDALAVEFLDRSMIRRAERDMGAGGALKTLVQIEPERGLALW